MRYRIWIPIMGMLLLSGCSGGVAAELQAIRHWIQQADTKLHLVGHAIDDTRNDLASWKSDMQDDFAPSEHEHEDGEGEEASK